MPRNTRLSTYYTLHSSPKPTDKLPTTREEALTHAEKLTKTLPLSTLLTQITKLRNQTESLQTSLTKSTLSHYQHLQNALEVCKTINTLPPPPTDAIDHAITLSNQINHTLSTTRASIAALTTVRTLENLQHAAEILSDTLPKLASSLPLCTDPDALQTEIHTNAQRFSTIRPTIAKLGNRDMVRVLDQAAFTLCHALKSEQTVMPRGEVAKIRLLLHDNHSEVRADFVTSVMETLHTDVTRHGMAATPLGRAVQQVHLLTPRIAALHDDVKTFEQLFGESSWVHEVVHEGLCVVRNNLSDVLDDIPGVENLRSSLKGLRDVGEFGEVAVADVENSLAEVAKVEAGERMKAILKDVGDNDTDVVKRVEALRARLITILGCAEIAGEAVLMDPVTGCDSAKGAASAAALCQLLQKAGWHLGRLRDVCVERCIQALLASFRRRDSFLKDLKDVEDIGKRFAVDGLVDDDLGEGLRYRVLGGVVEVVREVAWETVEVENVLKDLEGVDAFLDKAVLMAAFEDRRFE